MPDSLFTISRDLLELQRSLEDLGDMPEDQACAIGEWINSIADEKIVDRDIKLDNYAALIGDLEARAEIRKAESKRLSDRAQVDLNQAKALKLALHRFFELHQLKTVDTPRYKITLANNGGKLPLLLDDICVDQLPDQFVKTEKSVNKDAVRAALDSGEVVQFARFGDRGKSLRIK